MEAPGSQEPNMQPHLRIARPTDRLDELAAQYCAGLGMVELGRFEDHAGFDGVMVGYADPAVGGYHLEFTQEHGVRAGGSPSEEHLMVFYLPGAKRWQEACERMTAAGFQRVTSHNPYWDRHGRTFQDLDGYRLVLQNTEWPI